MVTGAVPHSRRTNALCGIITGTARLAALHHNHIHPRCCDTPVHAGRSFYAPPAAMLIPSGGCRAQFLDDLARHFRHDGHATTTYVLSVAGLQTLLEKLEIRDRAW